MIPIHLTWLNNAVDDYWSIFGIIPAISRRRNNFISPKTFINGVLKVC